MANTIDIIIKAIDNASKELNKIKGEVYGLGTEANKAAAGTENVGMSLGELDKTAAIAVAAIAAFGVAAKKAWDLAYEGAQIQQTDASFKLLLKTIGASPKLLDELSEASRGTIDDMSLMSSTATLLAGTTGQFGKSLADATPQLLEIAKAANKLNPSLGDTAFMYQSIATGVKRASPMILDNLGLTIKVGKANEEYAKQLGKTVEQLTAEEQKTALLNETLRAGKVLIEQVGDNVDSATDSYERLKSSTKNLADATKKDLAGSFQGFNIVLADTIDKFIEYQYSIKDFTYYQAEAAKQLENSGLVGEVLDANIDALATTLQNNAQVADNMTNSYTAMALQFGITNGTIDENIDSLEEVAKAAKDASKQYEGMLSLTKRLTDETENFTEKTDDLKDKQADLKDEIETLIRDGWSPQSDKVLELQGKYDDLSDQIDQTAKEHRQKINEMIYDLTLQKLSVDGLTIAEYNMALKVGVGLGVLSEAEADHASALNILTEAVSNGTIREQTFEDFLRTHTVPTVAEVVELIKTYGTDLDNLPDTVNTEIVTEFTTLGEPPVIPRDVDYWRRFRNRAGGGSVTAGMPYIVGETQPELFVPDVNGTILPSLSGLGSSGNSNITVNLRYSPTVSLGDKDEARNVILPYILDGIRSARANGLV